MLRRLPVVALVFLLFTINARIAAETAHPPGQASQEPSSRRVLSLGLSWALTLAPGDDLYPHYLADPLRSTFSLQRMYFSRSEIFDTGSPRIGLKLGGLLGLFRIHRKAHPERGLQINIEAAFQGQFDSDHSTDNVGWDGVYGLMFSWKPRDRIRFRTGAHHVSSHIGDEYAERTGRTRINYTRGEYLVGVSADLGRRWQVYGEAATAFDRRNPELQKRGRAQLGAQYETEPFLWQRLGWYAAVDTSAYEERSWDLNVAVQAGITLPSAARTWRFGVELYDGRSLMGEFFLDDERHAALGVWLDL